MGMHGECGSDFFLLEVFSVVSVVALWRTTACSYCFACVECMFGGCGYSLRNCRG